MTPNQARRQCSLWWKERSFGGRVTHLQFPSLPLTTWVTFLCPIFLTRKVRLVISVLSKLLCEVKEIMYMTATAKETSVNSFLEQMGQLE